MKCDYCQCGSCEKLEHCSRKHCMACYDMDALRLWNVNAPGWKLCRGYKPNPLRFVRRTMDMDYSYYIIKTLRGMSGLEPFCTPAPGSYLIAMEGRISDQAKLKGTGKSHDWCIVPYEGMQICLRNKEEEEYEIIRRI